MAEKNMEILNPDLQFTEDQNREFDRLLNLRNEQGKENQSKRHGVEKTKITHLKLDLTESQNKIAERVLYDLYRKWEIIYTIHLQEFSNFDQTTLTELRKLIPEGMSTEDVLNERDLSLDERYAIFWGFHAWDDASLHGKAANIILYENTGTIKERLRIDVLAKKEGYDNKRALYRNSSSIVSPSDYFNEIVKDMYEFYDKYDIRKGSLFNTVLAGSIAQSMKTMQSYEHPMSLNEGDQRMRRRIQAALDVIGKDADDLSVLNYLQEKALEEKKKKDKTKRWNKKSLDTDDTDYSVEIDIPKMRRILADIQSGFRTGYVSMDIKTGEDEDDSLSDNLQIAAKSEGYGNPEDEMMVREMMRDLIHKIESKLERMSRVMLSCLFEAYDLASSGRMGEAELARLYSGRRPFKRKLSGIQAIKKGAIARFRQIYPDANAYSAEVFFDKVFNVFHAELHHSLGMDFVPGNSKVPSVLSAMENVDDTFRRFSEDMLYEENIPAWNEEKEYILSKMEEKHADDAPEDVPESSLPLA